ncbi:hypothetical protein KIPE111705_13165 [Kibdelosporangium persicum]|uniref:Uncharacterized protein n=1 Tax=Kibdelosporangium persicum TaxID=2698649 RepID=A0ABX2F7B5_9PSEU|nr:hypothetical protein [Kibdelosporangium persicum]NRN67162.1 hypothetical protein [Kibdelosporangium persicum]
MKTRSVLAVAGVAAVLAVAPTYAYATCDPQVENLAPARAAVSEELAALAPYKAGADSRDLTWVKDNVEKMVPDWLPNTKRIATQAKPDLVRLADDCYQAGQGTAKPDLTEFVACVKRGLLTEVFPEYVPELPALCKEFEAALADPAITDKSREWARHWVNEYVKYRETRPEQ